MIDESSFKDVKVVATGGMSQLLTSGGEKYFNVIDRALSLKGLKILYDMNKGDHL